MYNYGSKQAWSYDVVANNEKNRAKGFVKLKEYENFYLYGKYDEQGNLLYKECFSKFDIDGVQNRPKRWFLAGGY